MHPVMQLKNAQNCLGGKAKSINVEYKSYGQFHEFKVYGMKFYLLPIHTKALFNLPYESTKQPNKSRSYGESKRDHPSAVLSERTHKLRYTKRAVVIVNRKKGNKQGRSGRATPPTPPPPPHPPR